MLTTLQKNKLERFFYILDYDRNGYIEKEDFIGTAENLCILWGIYEGDRAYEQIMNRYEESWEKFTFYIGIEGDRVNWDHWIKFAEEVIVNGDVQMYDRYVEEFVGEIFDNFDKDKDGYISLDEFIDLFVSYHIEVRYSAKSFRKLDINKDGFISRGELIEGVKQYFRSDDPNAPGNWLFGINTVLK